jgi:hypothetical protein
MADANETNMPRKSPQGQRPEDLERDFETQLTSCLQECAIKKRWGLFGQDDSEEAAKYLHWGEAFQLRAAAREIRQIRLEWGGVNPSAEKFLEYCDQRGANLPGEPNRAKKLLEELHFGTCR